MGFSKICLLINTNRTSTFPFLFSIGESDKLLLPFLLGETPSGQEWKTISGNSVPRATSRHRWRFVDFVENFASTIRNELQGTKSTFLDAASFKGLFNAFGCGENNVSRLRTFERVQSLRWLVERQPISALEIRLLTDWTTLAYFPRYWEAPASKTVIARCYKFDVIPTETWNL